MIHTILDCRGYTPVTQEIPLHAAKKLLEVFDAHHTERELNHLSALRFRV